MGVLRIFFNALPLVMVLLVVEITESNGWLFKEHRVDCNGQPGLDLSNCHRVHSPCNPYFKNPCGKGCRDMCCARDFPTKDYLCFKKGECGQFCAGTHGWWNQVGRCGCKTGLRCHKYYWYQAKKCKP